MTKEKTLAMIKTYLRAAAAAVAALFIANPDQPLKNYFAAGLAAIAGPLLKALDSKESAFGIGADK
tara:strand:+ start:905 stop:1102 length:198 start_codon:yes stop_codon:yes gene_type:complete